MNYFSGGNRQLALFTFSRRIHRNIQNVYPRRSCLRIKFSELPSQVSGLFTLPYKIINCHHNNHWAAEMDSQLLEEEAKLNKIVSFARFVVFNNILNKILGYFLRKPKSLSFNLELQTYGMEILLKRAKNSRNFLWKTQSSSSGSVFSIG